MNGGMVRQSYVFCKPAGTPSGTLGGPGRPIGVPHIGMPYCGAVDAGDYAASASSNVRPRPHAHRHAVRLRIVADSRRGI